jgi:hypothetical protein
MKRAALPGWVYTALFSLGQMVFQLCWIDGRLATFWQRRQGRKSFAHASKAGIRSAKALGSREGLGIGMNISVAEYFLGAQSGRLTLLRP